MLTRGSFLHLFRIALAFIFISSMAHALPVNPNSYCAKRYLSLFENPDFKITIAIGYDDVDRYFVKNNQFVGKEVYGKIDHDSIVKVFTARCLGDGNEVCGFTRSGSRPTVLSKTILGPDGSPKNIHVEIDYPELSQDDKANRGNPAQEASSRRVEDFFLEGIKNSQVTFYLGHSRDGGGPDFDPPVLNGMGLTDYDYYHANHKDRQAMINALMQSPNKPRMIGLLACSSIRWFSERTRVAAPATGFLGTTDSMGFSPDSFAAYLQYYFNRLFKYDCLDEFMDKTPSKKPKAEMERYWRTSSKDAMLNDFDFKARIMQTLFADLESTDFQVQGKAYQELKRLQYLMTDDQKISFNFLYLRSLFGSYYTE